MHLAKTEMKQIIERLRELEAVVDETGDDEIRVASGWPEYAEAVLKALPQLLDRLERLENVVEAGRKVVVSDFAFTMADSYGLQLIRDLEDALAALNGGSK